MHFYHIDANCDTDIIELRLLQDDFRLASETRRFLAKQKPVRHIAYDGHVFLAHKKQRHHALFIPGYSRFRTS